MGARFRVFASNRWTAYADHGKTKIALPQPQKAAALRPGDYIHVTIEREDPNAVRAH